MSVQSNISASRTDASLSALPTWRLVLANEMRELWIGGRALNLLILFSFLMSITAFLLASNSELSLIPPKQMVFVAIQSNITFGLFIGLIVGADSISGERERATLEAVLLTPTSRRQIVLGKLLAALSPWPAALIFSIPYAIVLSQGDAVLVPALIWSAITGTLLAAAFTSFGLIVSIFAKSNRTSMLISLLIYLASLLPTQLPGETQAGSLGALLQAANPLEAVRQFLMKLLLDGLPFSEISRFLVAPALLAIVLLGVLFLFASPRLQIEGGVGNFLPAALRRTATTIVMVTLLPVLGAGNIKLATADVDPDLASDGPNYSPDSRMLFSRSPRSRVK